VSGINARFFSVAVTEPDSKGRAATSTSAATAEATMGWTVTASDWYGYASVTTGTSATTPSAIVCPYNSASDAGSQVTCSSGNTVTVTDESGVGRTNTFDGLGRLTQVVENGIGATTTYSYDVQGNLTGVTQGTTGSRGLPTIRCRGCKRP